MHFVNIDTKILKMQMGSWVLFEMSIRVLLFPKYVIDVST
jgi:hypothetical protein